MTFNRIVLTAPILFLAIACGGGGNYGIQQPQAPTITTQPVGLSLAVGQSANFSVAASGTSPISYQWSWNGSPVTGATNASFSPISVAIPADNGSVFTVTVTNAVGSVTSGGATLTVSAVPRAPKKGDLRFKDVDAFPYYLTPFAGLSTLEPYTGISVSQSYDPAIGTPIGLGGEWLYIPYALPVGMQERGYYCQEDSLLSLESDLDVLAVPNTVITSLDINNNIGLFANSWVKTSLVGAYSGIRQTVQLSAFQAAATQAANQGQVITAVSYNAGQVYFISYGWDQDSTTLYEVTVSTATLNTIGTASTNLSSEGYIITAIGGNSTDGYLLVGTRVKGDSMSRPIELSNQNGFVDRGYAAVGIVWGAGSPVLWIGQQ